MQLHIERRAEIALRSLEKNEQKQIYDALNKLLTIDRATLSQSGKLRLLASSSTSKKLFVYRGNQQLRLVLTFEGDKCILEDVVNHDRLNRVVKFEGQK